MAVVDIIPPFAAGVCNIFVFLSYLVALAVFGGGVGAKARGGWFGVNAITEMGYSYILVCIAMFLSLIAGGILLAAKSTVNKGNIIPPAPLFLGKIDCETLFSNLYA